MMIYDKIWWYIVIIQEKRLIRWDTCRTCLVQTWNLSQALHGHDFQNFFSPQKNTSWHTSFATKQSILYFQIINIHKYYLLAQKKKKGTHDHSCLSQLITIESEFSAPEMNTKKEVYHGFIIQGKIFQCWITLGKDIPE